MEHTKNMVLIPQDVLRSIQAKQDIATEPQVTRLQDLDAELKAILSSNADPDSKFKLYQQTLQRYLFLKEKQRQPLQVELASAAGATVGAQNNDLQAEIPRQEQLPTTPRRGIRSVITSVPPKGRAAARMLVEHLEDNPDITWNNLGELIIGGERILDSNVLDMIKDLSCARKGLEPSEAHVEFVRALRRTNVPHNAIGNKHLFEAAAAPASPIASTPGGSSQRQIVAGGSTSPNSPSPSARSHKGHGLAFGRWLPYHI
jgi:hypothetical protein